MATRSAVYTAEEVERMGDARGNFELVRGELVAVSPAGGAHGILALELAVALRSHVRDRRLGRVYADGTGFVLARNPETMRGPDVAFVSRERDPALGKHDGFIPCAPDLAVEIVSPDNTLNELFDKAAEYLAAGTTVVWVVDPRERSRAVHVITRGGRETLGATDVVRGGELLPGFELNLSELFAEV